ncbi:HTTM domain-containing protein [Halobacterium noricense]|uniref:HTTM domain-containing protein n=1 Tax=Halobacterium noricense TaxID=223182 RepID=UPI001E39BF2C|nr:HTTM domain-containing protein [Halobacterium noricense]UHH26734.1 HTTM domain-containing protein [Halobacterium noricense]
MTARLRAAVARRFGVDTRALAALRVSLAALVLVDLCLRARFLTAFYTDAGLLPRSLLFEQYGTISRLSIHAVSGAAWVQAVLFLVTALAALAMLAGYRTTLATVVTGVLLASLHYRNPLVLNSGDTLLRMLFLWGVFLPLGERWSVDALRDGETDSRRVASVATAGVLVQVVVVYSTNALLKLRGERWLAGDAIRYVLELDMFTVLLGDVLADFPALLVAFDRLWLAMLVASVLLLVLTGCLRAAFAGLFVAMHAGMLASMQLGLFPLVSIAALLPFLPGAVWDRIPGWQHVPGLRSLPASRYARRVEGALPLVALPAMPSTVVRWTRRVVPVVLVVLLAGMLVWNAASVGVVDATAAGPVTESPEPRWSMFAPVPASTDYWVVAPGQLASGGSVDAFHGEAVSWDEPPDVAGSYPSARWRKYVANLRGADPAVAGGFADYLCTRWNGGHDVEVTSVAVFVVEQQVRLDGPNPTERVELAAKNCSSQ